MFLHYLRKLAGISETGTSTLTSISGLHTAGSLQLLPTTKTREVSLTELKLRPDCCCQKSTTN
nr:uncharacterized protein CTRU02_10118 [Colletotrichum truncatum]KAF6787823.1 hypothetical protein CTRU02_10118 [Colletotrichum truncatum]